VGKVVALGMACKSSLKWNFAEMKKYQNTEAFWDFATIFRFKNSTSKYPYRPINVSSFY
jgi:hypothetical protein